MSNRKTTDDTRKRLLDHGVALMLMNGYRGAGLSDILKAAQVPKGSFYYYFESKEAFGAEAIAHYLAPFLRRLGERLREPGRNGLDALAAYFRELASELEANGFKGGCLLGNLMGEIADASPASRAALKKGVDRYRDLLADGIARAQIEGVARKDRSPRAMADLLIDGWQGAMLRMKIEQSAAPLYGFIEETLLGYCAA
ncbi:MULTISPECIES: TetR/AcrR family transcriptional regulator [Methylocystis]|uniref:TetR/AcrR family transcriptional regulator n=1 Tax=Methylocystis TaxID=133 RepID=UPI001923CF74|nr:MULTISPECIES: TetR/AcrR family transcriptional regulator [Methylocystis]MBL1258759.1 TetR family transcriptional regulator C-terminal domain-containing protein [Methylocystis sp. Sn-Cys]